MSSTEPRAKIAVFIDFDNIEIGVKSTLGSQFDVGVVLDAIKERGEVVTKVAYSDWKRAGDHSRQLTQHAIRMVQRNMTPGGDKNGADITMALDALEMAFTHDHINTFVIVGGDSDFMPLVEKLKQYDRKVLVCGGRQFTSVILQKNCHEFIAYENLIGRGGRSGDRGSRTASSPREASGVSVAPALPLVQRALKVLSEREVSPQLGLLKSTLLQLDSTFSERDYGASSFRDFIEKVAEAGVVTLKHAGRSLLVEPVEKGAQPAVAVPPAAPAPEKHPAQPESAPEAVAADAAAAPVVPIADASQNAEGLRQLQAALQRSAPARWPMYIRQMKQYLKGAIDQFDERRYGFATLQDLLRAAAREGILRLERDRQGVMRVFPGTKVARPVVVPVDAPVISEPDLDAPELAADSPAAAAEDEVTEAEAVEAEAAEVPDPVVIDAVAEPEPAQAEASHEPQRRARKGATGGRKRSSTTARKGAARKTARKKKSETS